MTLPKAITESMASNATGYCAVIDGVLDIRTASNTQNSAALNALFTCGYEVTSMCKDPDTCDCIVKILEGLEPNAKIVAVTIKAQK